MVDKFNSISLKVRVDSASVGRDFLDGAALKKKWDRLSSLVDAKYGISSEGANLSGLEEAAKARVTTIAKCDRCEPEETD